MTFLLPSLAAMRLKKTPTQEAHSMPSNKQVNQLQEKVAAYDKRMREALHCYRPAHEMAESFHKSFCKFRLLRGGNRSSKSCSAFLELGSAITGQPIIARNGKKLPWHHAKGTRRIFWVIGYDQSHIGQTIHRYLFQEGGPFKIIQDEHTRVWRCFNPNNEYDKANIEKIKDCEPIIPERFIDTKHGTKGFAWEDSAKNIFSSVKFRDGSKLYGFPSTALQAKQGDPVTEMFIDEDIRWDQHLTEFKMRLCDMPDPHGRFVWAAFPHTGNQALQDLSADARREEGMPNQQYVEFQLSCTANPYVSNEQKEAIFRNMSPEERRARDLGEFVDDAFFMYPDFAPSIHGIGPVGFAA